MKLEDDLNAEETSSEDEDELPEEARGLKHLWERDEEKESWDRDENSNEDEHKQEGDDDDDDEEEDANEEEDELTSMRATKTWMKWNVCVVFTRLEIMAAW